MRIVCFSYKILKRTDLSKKNERRGHSIDKFQGNRGSKRVLASISAHQKLLLIGFVSFISKSEVVLSATERKGGVDRPQALYIIVYKVYHVAVPSGAIDNTRAPSSHISKEAG